MLERHHMQAMYAETAGMALPSCKTHDDIDIVLMDVMMPEMGGYETIRAIRQLSQFRSLPMIALTATKP